MSRVKKQKLSLEELLEEALVKKEEYPYEVPSNWVWTRLNYISYFERGITFPASAKQYNKVENTIPCIRTANIQEKLDIEDLIYVDKSYMKNNINKIIKENDILMSSANSRELVGKTCYIEKLDREMTFGGFTLNIRVNQLNSKFLYYFLRLEFLSGKFKGESTQTTNIANINTKSLGNYMSPLPPLAEQRRIVERIESLFEKLDKAKELAQDALESFEKRKAAILHKAFTGELTAKWREENSINLDSWELCEVGKLGEVKGGKRLPKGESLVNENTGFPYIKARDLKNGTVLVDRLQYVTPEIQKVIKNYTVKKGDIYITIVGACIGDVGVIPEEVDGANLTENAAKITNLKCNNKYLAICLSSSKMQQQIKEKIASATLGKLSLTSIKSLIVPLPTFQEQCEIVDILENLLDKEVQAQELCDVIAKIDLMKKSILARAFRGELGTNKPEEESAIELLKEVLKEKL